MKTNHPALMHYLLSSELLQFQESVSQVCDRPCPFCQREYERPIDLQHHVAGHLESTALLSLPNLDNIDEISEAGQPNSNSANRNYAESRAGDFDFKEPLAFLENDLSGDITSVTETKKELFRRKLEVESIPFDSMNEFSVEARQGYSSDLAGEWLSRLPIDLVEDGELPIKSHSKSSSNLEFASEFVELSGLLWKVLSVVSKKCESGTLPDLSPELRFLQEKLQRPVEAASSQSLSDWQKSKISAIKCDCENLLTDIDKITFRYRHLETTSSSTRTMAAWRTEVDRIRSWLTSISSKLSVLNTSYVTPTYTSSEVLTFRSLPLQVIEGAIRLGEDLESSGLSRMQTIRTNLIAPGPHASNSEGEPSADDQTTPLSIPTSFSVTDSTEFSIQYGVTYRDDWLRTVFSQSSQISPTTFEEDSDRSSACFGIHVPGAMANLEAEGNVILAEFRFQNDRFIVRIYDRPYGNEPKILCCTTRPVHHEKDSLESLKALNISRRGSFLDLTLGDGIEEPPGLWARFNFPDYESTCFRDLYLGLSLGWWPRYHDSHNPRGLQNAQ